MSDPIKPGEGGQETSDLSRSHDVTPPQPALPSFRPHQGDSAASMSRITGASQDPDAGHDTAHSAESSARSADSSASGWGMASGRGDDMRSTGAADGYAGPANMASQPVPMYASQPRSTVQPHGTLPYSNDPLTQGEPAVPHGAKRERAMSKLVAVSLTTALVTAAATGAIFYGLGAFDNDTAAVTTTADAAKNNANSSVPVADSTVTNPDWQKVAAAVSDSVVAIEVTSRMGGSEGSGVMWDKDGNILTNNHVISSGSQGAISVSLRDGRVFEATIVGTDAATDLAVIKLTNPPSDLKPATFGDSEAVNVGDPIMAVGNPLGLDNTVTTGIVSATDRPVTASSDDAGSFLASETSVTNAIQLDAAINPGNSGGPAFNAQGEVVGVTSSIATLSQSQSQSGSIGLGFAIPSNVAENIAKQLIDKGSADHAYLGVTLDNGTAKVGDTTWTGAEITSVSSGTPADDAGVRQGDVVTAIDGNRVGSAASLQAFVRAESSGAKIQLTVVRDGKEINVNVTLAAKADS